LAAWPYDTATPRFNGAQWFPAEFHTLEASVVMVIILFVMGLVLLIVGAEALVRGASRLAAMFGISSLVVGLTVVAFGTSSPELAVSINAALNDQASIALGNVVGSNIFNVLFILGAAAMIVPLVVSQDLIRRDVPLMIAVSVVVWLFAFNGLLSRVEGLALCAMLATYIGLLIVQSRRETAAATPVSEAPPAVTAKAWLVNLGLVAIGLALLVIGSKWLVDGAVTFARHLGVSELVVGLTIVAAGTSLPEVVTSIIAALRGERDIAVGNVVGSNLFNLMGVLGIASVVAPAGMAVTPAVIHFDLPVMIAVAFACLPIFFTGGEISRREGSVLFAYYLAYTTYLVLAATQNSVLPSINAAMLYFLLPLTFITLLVLLQQERRKQRVTRG
jgi:cation:H+ antiporter